MIKALIFDLDNTLIDRQRAFREMLYRRFKELKLDETKIDQMVDDIIKWDNNGEVPRLEVFQQWIDKYHITEIDAKTLDRQWSEESGTVAFLYDDVRETLSRLKEKYRLAVLSNGNSSSQRRKMNSIKIDDLLDYSLISGEFHVNKPDPQIYRYVCDQLGVRPQECIYIGDNYRIDVEGLKNAGMEAIYIDRFNKPHPGTTTIHEIKDLLEIL